MFQKVHLRLTFLCAGVTITIMLIMSLGYLKVSERSLKNSHFTSFQKEMNTFINTLEHQTVITPEWLMNVGIQGKYQIQIIDNEVPLLFHERNTKAQKELFRTAWNYYETHFKIAMVNSTHTIFHIEFPFSSNEQEKDDYYACIAISEQGNNSFQALILAPLQQLESQIRTQRILFFILNLMATIALSLFSWYFIRQLLKPLEESQRKQTQFVAAASHELRTPLAVILSCSSALEQASDTEKKVFLDSIQSEGKRMSRLVDDLLLLTSSEQRRFSICKEPAELDTLLLNAYEVFEPLAAEKSIQLLITLPDTSIPACPCDKERIQQVIAILIHNAISYTSEGGHVALSLSFHKQKYFISVIDNGIGIPDEEKKHIFERFYRADPSRSPKDHFGLGLSIASEIIHEHHGTLQVKDTPGGGSTFTITLACGHI